jgi:hypothetical protein
VIPLKEEDARGSLAKSVLSRAGGPGGGGGMRARGAVWPLKSRAESFGAQAVSVSGSRFVTVLLPLIAPPSLCVGGRCDDVAQERGVTYLNSHCLPAKVRGEGTEKETRRVLWKVGVNGIVGNGHFLTVLFCAVHGGSVTFHPPDCAIRPVSFRGWWG